MARVIVRILHVEPGPGAGPLERLVADARRTGAARLLAGFREAGADDVRLLSGPPDDTPFGRRLGRLVGDAGRRPVGLVVLGAGSIPLAGPRDLADLVRVAGADGREALANSFYSADVVAIARVDELPSLPDLPSDNALPRWLRERAGWTVADLRARWRLAIDLDGPLDVELMHPGGLPPELGSTVRERLAAVRSVAGDRRAELVVAGRTNAPTLRWLERSTACRIRALVEERGLRASSPLAPAGDGLDHSASERGRPPRSVLGLVLDRDGPEALGAILAELGDGALIDSRILLAHRLGADERNWPTAEDRFASDLLLADRIRDPWLARLTRAAAEAPIPVVLGGHTLVGPGIRLALRAGPRRP